MRLAVVPRRAVLAGAFLLVGALAAPNPARALVFVTTDTFSNGSFDQANGIVRAGGFNYSVGLSSHPGSGNTIWLAKYDNNLVLQTSATLTGTAGGFDGASGVAADSSNNIYVVGYSSAAGQGLLLWLGKFTPSLAVISSRTYAGISMSNPYVTNVIFANGNLVTANSTFVGANSEILLAQFNPATLALISSATYFNGFNGNAGYAVSSDTVGNLYVAGSAPPSLGHSNYIWLGKFSSSLAFSSSTMVSSPAGNTGQAFAIQAFGTNIYVGGAINNTGIVSDAWVAEYDQNLNPIASRSVASPVSGNASAAALVVTSSKVYVTGNMNTGTGSDVWLAELDHSLNILSSTTFSSGGGDASDVAYGLTLDTVAGVAYPVGFITPGGTQKSWIGKFTLAEPPPVSGVTYPPNLGYVSSLVTIAGTAQGNTLFVTSPAITAVFLTIQDDPGNGGDPNAGKYWNGGSWQAGATQLSATGTTAWAYITGSLATSLVNGSRYDVQSQAVDSLGDVEAAPVTSSVIFSTTPPQVSILYPTGGKVNNLANVEGTSSAPFAPVILVQLRVFDINASQYWDPGNATFDIAPAAAETAWFYAGSTTNWFVSSSTINGNMVNGHNYGFDARALDQAGNYSVPYSTVNATLDNTPPAAVGYGVVNSTGGLLPEAQLVDLLPGVTVQMTVSDAISGLVVSTYALAFAGDGHDDPQFTTGWGVMYSTNAGHGWIDGTWNSGTSVGPQIQHLAVFNGKLYAGDSSNGKIYWSADGQSWNTSNSGNPVGTIIGALAVFNGKLYAGDIASGPIGYIHVSADGNSWTTTNGGSPVGIEPAAMAVFNGKLYMGDSGNGKIYVSPDGNTWAATNGGTALSLTVNGLAVFNGKLYAADSNGGKLFVSADGVTFTATNGGTPVNASGIWPLAVFNNKLYTADCNSGGKIYVSADGNTWATTNGGAAVDTCMISLASYNGKLYAGDGNNGKIFVTADGNSWNAMNSGAAVGADIWALAGFNGKLYAGDNSNGNVYQLTPVPATLTGADGTTSAQTLSVGGMILAPSTNSVTCGGVGPCGATNQVIFTASDLAGNVVTAGPFAVRTYGDLPPAGCTVAVNVAQNGTADTTTIHGALAMLPQNLAGNECVVIRDTQTYVESVTVGGFTNYGYQVEIMADPSFISSSPVVSPPAGNAFTILDASVTIGNITILPTNAMAYAIQASSAGLTLSSVTINDASSHINTAGVVLSSFSVIFNSNISVPSADAVDLNGTGNFVGFSTITSATPGAVDFRINGGSSNTITHTFMSDTTGTPLLLEMGAWGNVISFSSFTTGVNNSPVISINNSSSNTVVSSYLTGTAGDGIDIGGNNNTLDQSTVAINTGAHFTVNVLGSAPGTIGNRVTRSFLYNPSGTAVSLSGGSNNFLSQDTIVNNSGSPTVSFNGVSSNTIAQSSIINFTVTAGRAVAMTGDTDDTVTRSTVVVNGQQAAVVISGVSDTIDNSYLQGAIGAEVLGATSTVIDGSYLQVNTNAGDALYSVASVGLAVTTNTITGNSQGDGIFLDAGNAGTLAFTSNTVLHASEGLEISTQSPSAIMAISGLTLQTLAAGATGINFDGGTFAVQQTFQNVSFDNSVVVNVNAIGLTGSTITMAGAGGPREGASFDHDPHGQLVWPPSSVLGCEGGYVTVCPAGCTSTTIGGVITGIPGTAFLGNYCIDIKSNNTYAESVTLQNYNNNGFQIVIGTTTGVFRPTISPLSGANAAFTIMNASVTLSNLKITPTHSMPYGVQVSSPNATLSGVILIDNSSLVSSAGVSLSSFSTISNSSVSVPDADGVDLNGTGNSITFSTITSGGGSGGVALNINGGSYNTITHSSLTNANGTAVAVAGGSYNFIGQSGMFSDEFGSFALLFNLGSSNTVTQSFISNPADEAAALNSDNSDTISQSTITSSGDDPALYIDGTSDQISQSYIVNLQWDAVQIDAGSQGVGISQSVLLSSSSGSEALYIYDASSTTVTGSLIDNPMGYGAYLEGGGGHILSQSTFTTNASGGYALHVYGSVSNTFIGDFLSNPVDDAAYFDTGATYNTLSQSTVTGSALGSNSLYIGDANNTVEQSYLYNLAGNALDLDLGATGSYVSQSTMTTNGLLSYALYLNDSNITISQSYMYAPKGYGAYFDSYADNDTIMQSTMASQSTGSMALNISGASNLISQSLITSTAAISAYVSGTNNVLNQDTFVSSGAGVALFFVYGSFNLASQSVIFNPTGVALDMYGDNNDAVYQSTITSVSGGGAAAAEIIGQSDIVDTSYIQGVNALSNLFSTGTVIDGSTLWATGGVGVSLFSFGALNLSVATTTVSSLPGNAGISLGPLNTGTLSFASDTVTGAGTGLLINAQPASTVISISTMIFSHLAAGSTAINFTTATFSLPLTFSNVSFDSSVAVNVNAGELSGSIVDMVAYSGPKAGPAYDIDPASEVQWLANVTAAPIAVAAASLSPSTAALAASNLPALRLGLSATLAGFGPTLNSLSVSLGGNAPSSNLSVSLWLDTVGDGVFRSTADTDLSDTTFDSETPPQAAFSFSAVNLSTATTNFFVTVSYSGMSVGDQISVVIPGPNNFGLSQGFAENQPIYPIQSAAPTLAQVLFAKPSAQGYPTPHGGASPSGGLDTGFPVQLGQTLLVIATGTWNSSTFTVTNATGTPALGGLGAALHIGSLVGSIGGGPWFQLGSSVTIVSGQTGDLFLAMDATSYSNVSGQLSVGVQVLVSTTPAIWTGASGVDHNASTNANWLNGLPPLPGDTVIFDGSLNANCNWDINNADIGLLEMTTSYSATVTIKPAANQLIVSSGVYVDGGVLTLGSGVTLISQVKMRIDYGTFDMGPGGSTLQLGSKGIGVDDGGLIKSVGSNQVTIEALVPTTPFPFKLSQATINFNDTNQTQLINTSGVLISSNTKVIAFNSAAFLNSNYNPNASITLNITPSPVSYSFNNLYFDGNVSTNVIANLSAGSTITIINASGPNFGSPFDNDPNHVIVWSPNGGGAPGTISGTIANFGGGSGNYCVQAFPSPGAAGCTGPMTLVGTGGGHFSVNLGTNCNGNFGGAASPVQCIGSTPGAYTLNTLATPNTYYLFAFHTSTGGDGIGYDARSGYGYAPSQGYASAPVFLGVGASSAGININLYDWAIITGTVTNNSNQTGPVATQAWLGPPGVAGSTEVAEMYVPPMSAGGSVNYTLSVPAASVWPVSFVDVSGQHELFGYEASSAAAGPIAAAADSVTNVGAFTLTGGGSAPGGVLSVGTAHPFTAHPGYIGYSFYNALPQPMMRLDLGASGSSVTITALRVDLSVPAPPGGFSIGVWRDDNHNGVFDNPFLGGSGPFDSQLNSPYTFVPPGLSSAVITFNVPETLPAGTTNTYFLTVDLNEQSGVPPFTLSIATQAYFGLSQGSMAGQPIYPVQTSPAPSQFATLAAVPATGDGNGGVDSGLAVAEDLTVQVSTINGTWRINASSTSGGAGIPGTSGLDTVDSEANLGQLIGRIDDGEGGGTYWFPIDTAPFTAGDTGELFLAINNYGGAYSGASGAVYSTFSVTGSTTGAISGTIVYAGGLTDTLIVTAYSSCQGCNGLNGNAVSTFTASVTPGTTVYNYLLAGLPADEYPGPYYQLRAMIQGAPSQTGGTINPVLVADGSTATGVNFAMSLGSGSVSGTLAYTGVQTGYGYFLAVFNSSFDYVQGFSTGNTGAYLLPGLPTPATYYVAGFVDVDGSGQPDGADPFGAVGDPHAKYSLETASPIFLNTSASLSAENLTLTDRGDLSGGLTLAGTATGADIVTLVGHGVFGSPGYVLESENIVTGVYGAAGDSFYYDAPLLNPATDYTLFAFLSPDQSDELEPGNPVAQDNGPIAIPAAGYIGDYLNFTGGNSPPGAVTGFVGLSSTTTQVLWTWNLVPGATSYQLLNSTGGFVAAVSSAASSYTSVVAPNTFSAITEIEALNGFGAGPVVSFFSVASLAAVPGTPTIAPVFQSSAVVSWASDGNSAGTIYEIVRATVVTGPYSVVFATTALSFTNHGLLPNTPYFWEVQAFNGDGIPSLLSTQGNATTPGASGASISGTILYPGRQAGTLNIQIATSATFSPFTSVLQLPDVSSQTYYAGLPSNATYFLRAFVDVVGDGSLRGGEDTTVYVSTYVGLGPVNGVTLSLSSSSIAPAAPVGLSVATPLGADALNWSAPNVNSNGTALIDLAGYRVYRSTLATGPFTLISAGTVLGTTGTVAGASFSDSAPVPGLSNYYRITAVDFAGNESLPASIAATPYAGGTISGGLQYVGTTNSGTFRIRLSTTPSVTSHIAETTLSSFSFTGLADGSYYVEGFRDLVGNDVASDGDPGGNIGGLAAPYAINIYGGNSVIGSTLTICDRTPVVFGQGNQNAFSFITSASGCPALDEGPNYYTSLFNFRVGGGAANSLGVGANINIQMQSGFANRLILLGPGGGMVAQDSTPGGANINYQVSQPGLYFIEPTSYNPFDVGLATISLTVNGGYSGTISGTIAYSGAQGGKVVVQVYNNSTLGGFPVSQSTFPALGAYSVGGLPDGVYYVHAYRDTNGNGAQDPGEPTGSFGVSASSLTQVTIQGGVAFVNGAASSAENITLTDPAVGTLTGVIARQGTQSGTIYIQVQAPQTGCTNCSLETIAFATIPAAGAYAVPFVPPATSYTVLAFVDVNGNGQQDALEAHGSTNPITVQANQATTVNLLVADPGSGAAGNSSITGTISYGGASTGPLLMGFALDSQFKNIPYLLSQASTGSFVKSGIAGGTSYYIAAFLDTNNNGEPDVSEGEPIGFYGAVPVNNSGSAQLVFVPSGGAATANITLGDAPTGVISGQVNYSGAAPLNQNLIVKASIQNGGNNGNFYSQQAIISRQGGVSTYNYSLPFLAAATNYNVNAFVDVEGNGQQQQGEPSGQYGQSTCGTNGCVGAPVNVSTGPGAFPSYGVNLTVTDPGQNVNVNNTQVLVNVTYLGSESGPIVVRFFTTSTYAGAPFQTVSVPLPPGPGQISQVVQGLPLGTYYIDAFRDASGTGILNQAYDAYATLNPVTLTQQGNTQSDWGNTLYDPGQGGSVNKYTGGFSSPGGARFDGGAVDIAAGVALDTITAGGPYAYVMGLTDQNQGIVGSIVKYSSAGVFLTSATLPGGANSVNAYDLDASGNLYLSSQLPAQGNGNGQVGGVLKLDHNLNTLTQVAISSSDNIQDLEFNNGSLYLASEGSCGDMIVRQVNPSSFVGIATGTFTGFEAAFGNSSFGPCTASGEAVAVDPSGNVYVVATTAINENFVTPVWALVKFPAGLGSFTYTDITSLIGTGQPGMTLATDYLGNVFLAILPTGASTANTYKFNSGLQKVASFSYSPVINHFNGGLVNMAISTDNYVYEAWESTANAGDFLALRLDNNLNLMYQRTFDGLDDHHEDFAFGIAVQDSSNVYLAGGVTNANNNLDWATVRLNMNASGAASSSGTAVAITTANATDAIYGALVYNGSLASSGTARASLFPLGAPTPIRLSSAPFAANVPYFFNNVPAGLYQVQAFIDLNNNGQPDAGEPVGISVSTGFAFNGSSSTVMNVPLCDRRPVNFGAPLTDTITSNDCRAADENGAYQRLYTFSGTRGQAVTIESNGINFNDAPVRLYDPNLALAASNDGGSGDSLISNYVLALTGLYTIAVSPYSPGITSATISLSLTGSAGSLGALAGSVNYTGGEGGKIALGLFSTSTFLSNLANSAPVQTVELATPGAFVFSNLATGTTYYLGGFIDVNGTAKPAVGEDVGYFGSSVTGPAPIYLRSGQSVSGVNFTITPATAGLTNVSGVVSYSGSQAGIMHVEFWANAAFSGQPAAGVLVPTGAGPYSLYLAGGQPYYVRAWLDAGGNAVLGGADPSGTYAPLGQGAQAVYVPSSGTLSGISFSMTDPGQQAGGISGEGLASLLPSTAPAGGQVFSATITYTAGSHGVNPGGTIGFTVPQGFPAPAAQFITVASTSTASFSALHTSPLSAFVTVNAGASVLPGQQVVFVYSEGPASCVVSTQTFSVEESSGTGVAPQPLLAGSPQLQVVQGPPAQFQPSNTQLSLTQGALSSAQNLLALDACGNQTTIPLAWGGASVNLSGQFFSVNTSTFVPDASVGLSTSVAGSTAAAVNVSFAAGQSSSPFYIVALTTGSKNLKVTYNFGAPTTNYYGLTVLPNNALTGVSVSTIPYSLGQTQASLTSNGGAAGVAYVNFTLGNPAYSWDVMIGSVPFKPGVTPSPLWETWGSGQPNLGQIAWDGLYSPSIDGGAHVPNGLYFVEIDVAGGGVHDDSLIVSVSVPQLAGHVYDAGLTPHPPLAGASLQVYGPNGTINTQTDSGGNYVLPGVSAGVYTMYASAPSFINGSLSATINAAGTVSTFTALSSGIAGSTNAVGGLDVIMSRASVLSVSAFAGVNCSTQASDQWGTLQVNTSTALAAANQQSFSLPLHLAAGTTSFDDGGQVDPGGIVHTIFNFNVAPGTWTAQASMPGFSLSSATVFVVPGVNSQALTLSPLSSVSGQVILPAGSNPNGISISLSAVALSTGASAGGGGVSLPATVLSATYTIANLTPGLYLLRANTNGLASVTTGPISVLASSAVTHIDFPAFASGASIGGVVSFNGAVPSDNLQVSLNAWAPGSLNLGSTNVYTTGGAPAAYNIQGLTAGATYQLYVSVSGNSNKLALLGTQPLTVVTGAAPVTANFTFNASSGIISGTILLPAGSVDFGNVSLVGQTIASINSAEVGNQFTIQYSTQLPGFACVPHGGAFANGLCSAGGGSSTATFSVQGLDTETDAITFYYATTGQSKKVQLSVVNGSTSTVFVDLSAQTFSISGSINNQVNNPLFSTNPNIFYNAPSIAPLGYPANLSATTARVTAIAQNISQYNVAISTVFNPLTSSVGFLSAAGTFTITNLPSGAYFVETADLRPCSTCAIAVPSVGQLVNVAGASVSSVTFTLTDGFTVSGQIALAGGPQVQDSRVFALSVTNQLQQVVASTSVYLGDVNLGLTANAVNYSFSNLPPNNFYTLTVVDGINPQKYVGAPIEFPNSGLSPGGLQASLSGQSVSMQRAAYITGQMQDANTGELITAANANLLAPTFQISATATPWVQGGFAQAMSSASARPIQANGYYLVGPLLPGIPYALTLAQTSWDPSFLAGGSQNYAPVTIGGLTPQPGAVMTLPVVNLNEGQSISGFVAASTTTGARLGNIEVTAAPSFGNSGVVVQTYTNQNGQYTLWVSSFISNEYNITAAPRGGNVASNGTAYSPLTLYNISLISATTADFTLTPLQVNVTGQILVADAVTGGQLSYPFGAQQGFPAAAVFMQAQGVAPVINPLGDISAITDGFGNFTIPGLSTGTYSLRAISQGYAVFNATVSVNGAGFSLFTASNTFLAGNVITLHRGATVTGRILNSDGTAPNNTEVGGVAAANFASGQYLVGTVSVDPLAKTVNSYSISGFIPGVSYTIVIMPANANDDTVFPPEGTNVSFAAAQSTTTQSINLTYAPPKMECVATAKALGNGQFQIKVSCNKDLRNQTSADNTLSQILAVSTYTSAGLPQVAPNGTGHFLSTNEALSTDRRTLTAVYGSLASETEFSLRLRCTASEVNPQTGTNFATDAVFDFYSGLPSNVTQRITNISGGSVLLQPSTQDEQLNVNEQSRIDIQPGTFAIGSDSQASGVASATTTISVGLAKALDLLSASELASKAMGYVPSSYHILGNASAFPAETAAAMSKFGLLGSTTNAVGGANPLSAFYTIFLPAGIRHELQVNADLTLSYSPQLSSGTVNENNVNVYYYNTNLGQYVIEQTNRRLDPINQTITVSVNHFSTFLVLDSTPVLSAFNPLSPVSIQMINFPNPVDCIVHSNIQRNSSLFAPGVIPPFQGTMLRFNLPGPTSQFGDATIRIYDLAGELVKTIDQGNLGGEFTYYTPWDCTNNSGRTVASGVYIGVIDWAGQHAYDKIAIIKGSGL